MIQLLTPPVVAAGDDRVIAAALDGQLQTIVAKINELITALGVARGTDSLIADGSLRWRMAGERLRTSIDEIARMIEPIRQVFQPDDLQYTLDGKTITSASSPDGQVFSATTYADKSASFEVDGPPEILYRVKLRLRTMAEDTWEIPGPYIKQHPFTNEQDGGLPMNIYGDPIEMLVSSPLVGAILNTVPLIPTIIEINTALDVGSGAKQFRLPLASDGQYYFQVEWGDGNKDIITTWNQAATTHLYSANGVYIVTITGICRGWQCGLGTSGGDFDPGNVNPAPRGQDRKKIIDILQWGTSVRFGSAPVWGIATPAYGFQGCTGLTTITAADGPCLLDEVYLSGTFWDCTNLVAINSIATWDMKDMSSIYALFRNAPLFNADLSAWDVSGLGSEGLNVTFRGATSFNSDISGWDVSENTSLLRTFLNATIFNQDIGAWDVSKVTTMDTLFTNAVAFKQNIGAWSVPALTTAVDMFTGMDMNSPNSATSRANYDALLTGWTGWAAGAPGAKGLALKTGVVFSGGSAKYTAASDAAAARAWLIAVKGWVITDGGAF